MLGAVRRVQQGASPKFGRPMVRASVVAGLLVAALTQVVKSEGCEDEEPEADSPVLLQHTRIPCNPLNHLECRTPLQNLSAKQKFELHLMQPRIAAYLKSQLADSLIYDYPTSNTQTLPLEMVEHIDFAIITPMFGNTSYPGILLPDAFSKMSFIPYSMTEYSFFINWQTNHDARQVSFMHMQIAASTADALEPVPLLNGATYHDTMLKIADNVNTMNTGVEDSLSFVQGNEGRWKGDEFAGQYIGHSFLACILEATASGELVLDLSDSGTSTQLMQVLKRKAVALVPSVLLKTRGYIRDGASGLTLVRVEVLEPSTGTWMSFESSSSDTHWSLAKMALFAEALFVMECFHGGFHLFVGTVTSALKMSVPPATALGSMMGPNTIQTTFTLFEQAAIAQSDHNSGFDGLVWPTENISAVQAVATDMARAFLSSSPLDYLGMDPSGNFTSPTWWAGMSSAFIGPISNFVASVANEVFEQSQQSLAELQAQLQSVGIMESTASLDVSTIDGLITLFTNLLFVEGILHTHMYAAREVFTPLVGWVSTEEFMPYLTGKGEGDVSLNEVLIELYPNITIDSRFAISFNINYRVTSGFTWDVPQLGDGPYNVKGDSATQAALQSAVFEFQASLNQTRAMVYEAFGDRRSSGWVPEYFYPVNVPKAFGCAITQTTYI
ncbi:unnamed protein product [Prorocentrum cordatum]|uniref:Lipoxygenase domain-containing protein n=1 Tax=Prorocentrum cordatum TaxID=2364126 RepID=A0ABN9TBD5_9DINO|nr:unnamed protein product [Polarella glacialis]